MKSLTAFGETHEAQVIIKTEDSIVGYTDENMAFSFKGISDFSPFSLDGDYDLPKEDELATRLATAEAETAALNLAIIDIWETMAAGQ